MGVDPSYEPMYRRVRDLQFKMQDAIDDQNHPSAHVLRREMQNLMDDIETKKSPRNLENRMKQVQHGLQQIRNQGDGVMDYGHVDEFHRHFESMRQDVRRFSNYS